jgi:hypothetical protein
VKLTGDRLAAIQKDHPAEYAEGMKAHLNPPTPVYANPYGMRPGMPGFGYPMPGYTLPGSPNAAPASK